MPKRMRNTHLYELAKRGAEVQFRELLREARQLLGLFPHLGDTFDEDELPLNFIMAKGSGAVTRKTRSRRRRMSAAERKAASARMKKYWAAKRQARAKA